MASLDIIIINWNTGRQLHECLESLGGAGRDGIDLGSVVVIDNHSSDGSADEIESHGLPISVIHNNENRGFAAACNQGAEGSEADYLLFLNPDTRCDVDSLSVPVLFMEQNNKENIGIAGIRQVDGEGATLRTCARFPTPSMFLTRALGLDRIAPRLFKGYFMHGWDHNDTRPVDHVSGAYYLVRRALFTELGGFDERFFVYLEDLDFSLRARAAGWKSWYLSDTRIYHRGGGASEHDMGMRLIYAVTSRIEYAFKHFRSFDARFITFVSLVIEPVIRIAASFLGGSLAQLRDVWSGYSYLWKHMGELPKSAGKK
jgi:GT2 family glycosyltransferase